MLVYKKLLFGPKSLRKVSRDGEGLVLNVGCDTENKKLLSKQNSPIRSLCLKSLLSLRMPLFFVMVGKNMWFCKRKYLKPKCGLL